jgi:uncharacterized protein (DUF488 family)
MQCRPSESHSAKTKWPGPRKILRIRKMKVFTIGFTKKSARDFFTAISRPDIKRIVDVRLNNISQLAGFSKRDDLQFFLKAICRIEYKHLPELAPTQEMLDEYKKHRGSWSSYEVAFLNLMSQRRIEDTLQRDLIDGSCLLCSEDKPEHCHRRLVAEYLKHKWLNLEIEHLV